MLNLKIRWQSLQEIWQPGYSRSYRWFRFKEALTLRAFQKKLAPEQLFQDSIFINLVVLEYLNLAHYSSNQNRMQKSLQIALKKYLLGDKNDY